MREVLRRAGILVVGAALVALALLPVLTVALAALGENVEP